MRRPRSWLFMTLALSMSSVACGEEPRLDNVYDNGITLTINVKSFDAKAHVIKKCADTVCLIDGKPASGEDGKIPQYEVTSLIFEKNGKQVTLDVSSMYDPWVENFNIKQHVTVLPLGKDSYQVSGYFGDGESKYVCQWLVMLDGSIRTHIGGITVLYELTTKVREDFKLK